MARINVPQKSHLKTYEGAPARIINAEAQLRRSVMACLLWEKQFYEDGIDIAERITQLVPNVDGRTVSLIANEARNQMHLRHVPLLITREMARYPDHKTYVAATLEQIIQRADELAEFAAIYWKDGKQPLSAQVKKGLARAFPKFDAYQLAKYDRPGAVRLRDVLFQCHAKPKDEKQAKVWKKLIDGTLEPPDTWEVGLSSGADKKETWTRLLKEKKMAAMAVLRNLRNFDRDSVDQDLVRESLATMNISKVLPFRFIAAARYAPQLEPEIEIAMMKGLKDHPKLKGHTVLLIDISGSMDVALSRKSQMQRTDAASGLAILAREICEQVDIFSFSNQLVRIPPRHGFALRDAIMDSQEHSGTYLGSAVKAIYGPKTMKIDGDQQWGYAIGPFRGQNLSPDRLIVITDEQSHDTVPNPKGIGYMINVGSYKHGVGYGPWIHIDGWSEAVIRYIQAMEDIKNPIVKEELT